MRKKILPLIAIVALSVSSTMLLGSMGSTGTRATAHKAPIKVTGDYVEARTASVFCGPCHYNGEAVTVGRDAVVAWNISDGEYDGVSLKGVKAVAAINSSENFNDGGVRKTELAFDTGTTDQQMAAFTKLLKTRMSDKLGTIVNVARTSVTFDKTATGYVVNASGTADLNVQYRADDSCCVMPGLVWYEPFSTLEHRKVGYTESVSYTGKLGDQWYRSGEDSAFYGTVTF